MHCTNTVEELTPSSSSPCLRHLREMPLSSSCCPANLHVLFLSSPEDIYDDSDKDVTVEVASVKLTRSR